MFYHLCVYTRPETPYSSGFRGVKMVLVGVNDTFWAEKAYFCNVVK